MKNKLLLVVFSLLSVITIGQNYTISPSKTVTVSTPYDVASKCEIYFKNISAASITLKWQVISNTLVTGWDCYICDNVSCCAGVPQKGTMPYIDPGIEVYLALVVDPKNITGNGILKLYLYEDGDSTNGDTLTWIVNSVSTGVNDLILNSAIKIFPNPVSDYLVIDRSTYPSQLNTVCIYNAFGQKMFENTMNRQTAFEKLDVTSLPKGTYLLVIKDEGRKQITKTFIK